MLPDRSILMRISPKVYFAKFISSIRSPIKKVNFGYFSVSGLEGNVEKLKDMYKKELIARKFTIKFNRD